MMVHKMTLPIRFREVALLAGAIAALIGIDVRAQSPTNVFDYTRTSLFTYYDAADGVKNGLLKTEKVEPDLPQSCVVTAYEYDLPTGYGNKTKATTDNCAGATGNALFTSRSAQTVYGATASQSITVNGSSVSVPILAGIFATTSTNALSQSETKSYDPRFGAVLQLVGPNALATSWVVDDFGRVLKEIRADGTKTLTWYCVIGAGLDASSNSVIDSTACPAQTPGVDEAPADAVTFVHTEVRDGSSAIGVKMGPYVRVYSDRLGREIRTVTESFDGALQPIARRGVALVKDTGYSIYGPKVTETQPYFLASGSSTVAGSLDAGKSQLSYDALGRVTAIYVADPQGSQIGYFGSVNASRQLFAYSGLSTTITNDKGQTRQEEKGLNGQVIRVTDAVGAKIAFQHDAFGNLIQTKDARQNQVVVAYDIRGRKKSTTDPDSGLWTYDYNALGEMVEQQNATQRAVTPVAQKTTMSYDVLGRMKQRIEPEYTSTWFYDQYADASPCNKGIGKLCETTVTNEIGRKFVYDNLGRPKSTRTTIPSGPSFASLLTYETTSSRVKTQTYPTGLQIGFTYTNRSFLEQVTLLTAATINPLPSTPGGTPGSSKALPTNTVLWQAQNVNAWGKTEQQQFGNGVFSKASFDATTGRTTALQAGLDASYVAMNQQYSWDSINNLTGRTDNNGSGGAMSETFVYGDGLNRLTQYTVSWPSPPSSRTVTLQYNALGMLLYKSDVGNYSYPAQGPSAVRPHALQSVNGAVTSSYLYDANGNLTSSSTGKYRSIAYTSFNLPDSQSGIMGPSSSPKYTWRYDESHARFKEVRAIVGGTYAGTRTTWNLHPDNQGGLGFESEENVPTTPSAANPAVTSNRHYLSAGGQVFAVMVSTGALPNLGAALEPTPLGTIVLNKLEFWHKDHLGSTAATTDHNGALTQAYAYDPFGKRRQTSGQYDVANALEYDWSPAINKGNDRGYTGHEQLDDVGLVHMNGRIFDAALGTFLQADPLIQDPGNLQNYNRYGYCYNNPLTCTDPSGLSFFNAGAFTRAFINLHTHFPKIENIYAFQHVQPGQNLVEKFMDHNAWARTIGKAVASYYFGWVGTAYISGYETWLQGGSHTDIAKVWATAYATEALFGFVGDVYPVQGSLGNIIGHAVVGCITAEAGGGNCGRGAASAGFGAIVTGATQGVDGYTRFAIVAAAGGTASVIAGGKFADGALSAAYGYLYNCLNHPEACTPADIPSIRAAAAACNGDMACIADLRQFAAEAGLPVPRVSMGQALKEFFGISVSGAAGLTVATAPAAVSITSMSTAELTGLVGRQGVVALRQLFGSGVPGAQQALATTVVPEGLTLQTALAYREIAIRNSTQLVQQIRLQILDKVIPLLSK